ncbi:MAG: enoyl-CoA hydratase/isomerase family protein [Chloroflexi bacterium]|nr:enoyl-CoA hydratase/isomerase family protein [Chloroflexota bacterium]
MNGLVLRTDDDGIATLTFNRPEQLNALSPSLFVELRAHLEAIAAAPDTTGCVVLTGAGRSFSAGNDIRAIQSGDRAPSARFQAETIDLLESMPQPVIASVKGHCYTGALEVALGCDLLIAGESARFADTHGKWAMTPTWGMSQRLPRRIGPLRAKMMMFTGTPVTGADAVAIGLANLCVPDAELEATVTSLARTMLANSWHTLRGDKRLVNEGQRYTAAEALEYERKTSPGAGPDMAERLKAFGSKQ